MPDRLTCPASDGRRGTPSTDLRLSNPFQPGSINPRIEIGTNTLGSVPSVVPLNPRGATPTIVNDWPLITIVSLTTAGFPPSLDAQ